MHVLVCGGAGYIGSHMVKCLLKENIRVTVFDNLSTGHKEAIYKEAAFFKGDLLDPASLRQVFSDNRFDAVMHFSAKSLVGESVQRPSFYFRNNVTGTLNLLDAMRAAGVTRFVFSSTAAVYGIPETRTITETHPQHPINPYGKSKKMVEEILADLAQSDGIRSVSLRYFNAAGASPCGSIGERHEPETHLIPNLLNSLLAGNARLQVFGTDYPTPDGTCVRDYIHVDDLCDAHLLALGRMKTHDGAQVFNLGNGNGFSVLDVIQSAQEVTGKPVPYDIADRRPGDPPFLVADSTAACSALGWQPKHAEMADIIETAWRWHQDPRF